MTKKRIYSGYAQEAAQLMGEQIRLGRKQRKWTEQNLADRAGISRATLQKMEKGDMSCAVGLVFEVATLVDISLFQPEGGIPLATQIDHIRDKNALLPRRIKKQNKPVRDEF